MSTVKAELLAIRYLIERAEHTLDKFVGAGSALDDLREAKLVIDRRLGLPG